MIFCCTHRSVPCSVIIREASSHNTGRNIQRLTAKQCLERDNGTLSYVWDIPTKSFPSGFRELCGRGGRKILRFRGNGDTKERRVSKHRKADTHMDSQRLWRHAQGLQGSTPDGASTEKSGHKALYLIHSYLQLTATQTWKISFLQ